MMEKIIMIIIALMACVGCTDYHYYDVYQDGKIIDSVCRNSDILNDSQTVGGSYYKRTNKKCGDN